MKVWMRLALGRLDRLAAAVDVLVAGAREAADHGVLGALGDLVHGGEIAFGGDREAGLDDVDAHLRRAARRPRASPHASWWRRALLAVAQGGVEDDDAVLLGLGLGGHGIGSLHSRCASRVWALVGSVARSTPECPGANARPALRGR